MQNDGRDIRELLWCVSGENLVDTMRAPDILLCGLGCRGPLVLPCGKAHARSCAFLKTWMLPHSSHSTASHVVVPTSLMPMPELWSVAASLTSRTRYVPLQKKHRRSFIAVPS